MSRPQVSRESGAACAVIHDHVILEELCNLRCAYCPCFESSGAAGRAGVRAPRSADVTAANNNSRIVVRLARSRCGATALKVSGGEIFLIPSTLDLLLEWSDCSAAIQVLTNGTLLRPELVSRLRKVRNLSVQISLDGHREEMNAHRFRDAKTLARIIDGIAALSSAGIPVEINCVLTSANIEGFGEFVQFLTRVINWGKIFPFPVRGHPELRPTPGQVRTFSQCFDGSDTAGRKLLPPRSYLLRLDEVLRTGKRSFGCHVPNTVLATSSEGEVDVCTCGPVKRLGNILSEGVGTLDLMGTDPCYGLIVQPREAYPSCAGCFTHYDVISLFISGEVAMEEMQTIPLFSSPEVMHRLLTAKRIAEMRIPAM